MTQFMDIFSCIWAACCGVSKQVTSSGDYSEIPYVPLLDSGWLRGNTVKSLEPTGGIPKPRNVAIEGNQAATYWVMLLRDSNYRAFSRIALTLCTRVAQA